MKIDRDPRRDIRHPRVVTAQVAVDPEQWLPTASTIDVSASGLLLAFDEPVGLRAEQRVLVSLSLPDGRLHTMGDVTRVARGDDFRTYVALALRGECDELRRLSARLGTAPADDNTDAGSRPLVSN